VKNVYPNPADQSFFINLFSNNSSEVDVQIFDSFGRLVYQKGLLFAGDHKMEIYSATWAPGVYVIKVADDKKQFNFITKVVIQ
jgi:hypothetical protein